jgi:serine/threonine protein kinase
MPRLRPFFSHRAFGITLWEILLMGAIPYPGIRTQELFEMLVVENYRLSKPANCSSELYELLKDCWQPFPEQRPTFAQLLGRLQDLAKKPSRHILQGENYAYEFLAMPTDVCMRWATMQDPTFGVSGQGVS